MGYTGLKNVIDGHNDGSILEIKSWGNLQRPRCSLPNNVLILNFSRPTVAFASPAFVFF